VQQRGSGFAGSPTRSSASPGGTTSALGYQIGGLYGVPVFCGLISLVVAAVQIKFHLDENSKS